MALRSLVSIVAIASVSASPAASCMNICHFGGYNTSCFERIKWVKAHVNSWDQVVKHVKPAMALSCDQARSKVLKDCPVCQTCPTHGLCDYLDLNFNVGDSVEVLHYDKKWHLGHVTGVGAGGKYEVELKDIPLILVTSHLRAAQEPSIHTPVHAAAPSAVAPQKYR